MPYCSISASIMPEDTCDGWPEKPTISKKNDKRWQLKMRASDGRYVRLEGPEYCDYLFFLAELRFFFSYIKL